MSEARQHELQEKTQQLLQGPLKHIRAAALAAALLPLASVAATPAAAQVGCPPSSGGFCGVVFNDANNNGIQDTIETGIEGVKIQATDSFGNVFDTETGPGGSYILPVESGSYTIGALIPSSAQPSLSNQGSDLFDSDATKIVSGYSALDITIDFSGADIDFGFYTPPANSNAPGTGTPGFWKNHPDAWPVSSITIGGISYPKATAIMWLGKVGKDKTTTIFASLVSAKLNQLMGNEDSCIAGSMGAVVTADAWLAAHPVGSNVLASSAYWQQIEPTHQTLDAYNNGLLCAPHRN